MSLTTDPNDQCLKDGQKEKGQNECYLVLSQEERAKGYVRPLRTSYKHVGLPGPKYLLRDLTEDEVKLCGKAYAKFEEYPEGSKSRGKFWDQSDIDKIGKGCGGVTSMPHDIAATYSRDPGFYGRTFCATCNVHLPVEEFTWAGTNERVGS